MHKFFVWFNGCADLEIGIKPIRRPFFPALKKRYKEYYIDGKDGADYKFTGYENRTLNIEYNFIDRKNINETVRRIRRWLGNVKDNKLWFADDPSFFYIVKRVELEDIERKNKKIGKFKVSFILEPFAYSLDGAEEIEVNNNETLFNLGDFESKPIFKIIGEGEIKLYLNNNLIELNINGSIIINSKLELCYKDNLNNLANKQMSGDFPILKLDENTIRWEGDVKMVSIIPNYIYY